MKLKIGKIIADRYRILEPIGSGGAGDVYRAVHIQLNREVALKLVRTDVEPDVRKELGARFRREASLAAKLSHPNLVTIHDFGLTEQGLQYVVMELLDGRSLKSLMKEGPIPAPEAARIAAALARGLRHAHGQGLVHRDVKPSNVLLVRDDDGIEQPQLLDFGLVKSVDSDLEMTGEASYLGTPLYMSPEQVRRGGSVDHRTDVYALGCMMYGMFTSVMPYRGDGALATAMKHIEEAYPAMSTRAPKVTVPHEIERIVQCCMEKNPEDRFQDGGALATALEEWLESITVVQVPQRNWMISVASGFGLLGVLGLLVGAIGIASLWLSAVDRTEDTEIELVFSGEPVLEEAPDNVVSHPVTTPNPPPQVSPKPTPKPKPKPKPKPPPVTIDGVVFDGKAAQRALTWANTASWKELKAEGIHPRQCSLIVENRPYETLTDLGNLRGVGEKTMEAIRAAKQ